MKPETNDPQNNITPNSLDPTNEPLQNNSSERTIQPLSATTDIRAMTGAAPTTAPLAPSNLVPTGSTVIDNGERERPATEPMYTPASIQYATQSQLQPNINQMHNPNVPDNSPLIQDTPKRKGKKWILVLVLLLIALAGGYFAYSQLNPGAPLLSESVQNGKSGDDTTAAAKTNFIIPNVDYSGFDMNSIEKCLKEMTITEYEVECAMVNAQTIGNVGVTLSFNSGNLTDKHTPYLSQNKLCDPAGLSKVNKSISEGQSLELPSPKSCPSTITPKNNVAYLYTMDSTASRGIATQEYYFIKDSNIVVIQALLTVPRAENNQTVSADTLSTVQQNVLGFIDSMLE